jgi:hypothetical protein
MSAPNYSIVQYPHKNPNANEALRLTLIVAPNTSPEQIASNVVSNTKLPLEWLIFKPVTERPAIIVGGGPSAADYVAEIRALQEAGGVVFSMNGSSRWLRGHGIIPDWQVIADAKEETASLVDPEAKGHLFSSAVNPVTMAAVKSPIVWHPVIGGIEECFPDDRRKLEYCIVGGTSSGTHAMCIAYVLGHREMHCFGFDSSHRGRESHAYQQPMNDTIPNCEVTWAGKTYKSSIAMKAQAEQFQLNARKLVEAGCVLHVHGDGLLPAMWNTPLQNLTEKDKYRQLWSMESYRKYSPGELAVPCILEYLKPKGLIIDFGCGTGRASIDLAKEGLDVLLIDFADNCRDDEAIFLPFLEHDLTNPIPVNSDYGICCDVMEHIPPEDVEKVITNIMRSSGSVFFQISTIDDSYGEIIGQALHLTVKPHGWWTEKFHSLGFKVVWCRELSNASFFHVTR